jgi:predicted NBD/HSP70 family sugar kinase
VRPGYTHLALADFAGQVLAREDLDTPAEPRALAEQLSERVGEMLRDGELREKVHGVGIVVPGMVDRRSGTVLYAPRLGWRNVKLRDAISQALGLPVFIESAPIACALARLWSLNGKTRVVNNFAYVSVSDGIGVGIVHKGEVLRGETHTAGELGHVSLDPNGPSCACGRRGCWEAFACNAATVARYQALSGGTPTNAGRSTARSKAGPMAIEEIVRRAKVGEPAAVDVLVETGRQVGRGLANVASAFNPKRI